MSTVSTSVSLLNNGQLQGNPALPDTSDRCMAALGLEQNPFSMAPDIVNFYSSPKAETVIVEVVQMVETRMGFALLYGDVGLGKTTISRRILCELDRRGIATSLVFNTFYQGEDLVAAINQDFGIRVDDSGLASQMAALNDFLLRQRAAGGNCAIIIDDAQNLTIESLELVRQISNMETGIDKIVQVILIGQPELEAKLNEYSLRQLKSRIVLRRFFKPYSLRESSAYIRSKIRRAGDAVLVDISRSAIALVHEYSGGFPRRINVLMTRCLYAAVAANSTRITSRIVREAILDMDESPSTRAASVGNSLVALISAVLVMAPPISVAMRGLPYVTHPTDVAAATPAQATDRLPTPPPAATPLDSLTPREADERTSVITPEYAPLRHAGEFDHFAGFAADGEEPLARSPAAARASPGPDDRVTPTSTSTLATVAAESAIEPSPATEFLDRYGLSGFAPALAAALEERRLDDIAREIHRESGYRLLALPATAAVPVDFDSLALLDAVGEVESRLLLWRPSLWPSESFEAFYRKREVMALQRALAAAGNYDYLVDGVAGRRTDAALAAFQEQHGLDRSGVPDPATLFMLERLVLELPTQSPSPVHFTGD